MSTVSMGQFFCGWTGLEWLPGAVLDVRNPGHRYICGQVLVLLNGEDVTQHCFYADEAAGVVECYRKRDGAFVVAPDRKSVETEKLYGRVKINFNDGAMRPC